MNEEAREFVYLVFDYHGVVQGVSLSSDRAFDIAQELDKEREDRIRKHRIKRFKLA